MRAKLSDSYLQHRVEKYEFFRGQRSLTDDGWDRWGNASCLAKLITAENLVCRAATPASSLRHRAHALLPLNLARETQPSYLSLISRLRVLKRQADMQPQDGSGEPARAWSPAWDTVVRGSLQWLPAGVMCVLPRWRTQRCGRCLNSRYLYGQRRALPLSSSTCSART